MSTTLDPSMTPKHIAILALCILAALAMGYFGQPATPQVLPSHQLEQAAYVAS